MSSGKSTPPSAKPEDFLDTVNSLTAEDFRQATPPPPDALDSLTRDDVLEQGFDNLTLEDVRPSPSPAGIPQGQGDRAGDSSSALHSLHQSFAVPGTSTVGTAMESAAIGAAKAVIETKDLLTGGAPDQSNKWSVRRWIEDRGQQLRKESVVNGIAQSVAQFGVGFIGLGKIAPVAKGLEATAKAGKLTRFGAETTRAAVAGGTVMDPHEERLSNLVEQYPALRNPITSYLAARPNDSEAEGRLKNALEGIVMDTVLAGALTAATKAIRFYRAGNHEASNAAATEADDAFSRAIRGEQPVPDASLDPAITDAAAKVREMNLHPSGPVMNAEHGPMESIPRLRGESGESRIGGDGAGGGGSNAAIERTETSRSLGDDGVAPHDHSGVDNLTAGTGLQPHRVDSQSNREHVSDDSGTGVRDRGDSMGDLRTMPPHRASVASVEAQTATALDHVADDARALVQYGGRAEAIDAGYAFKSMSPPPSPGTTTSGIIPWQKFTSLDEAKSFTTKLIQDQSAYINARRGGDAKGVLSDKTVDAMVADRVKVWNENEADLRGALHVAGDKAPELAADMEASFLVANKAYLDSYELAQRISVENYTGYASRDEALQALQYRMATATAMYAEGKAIVSNAARSMRRMRGGFKITDDQLRNITTADPEQILKIVSQTNGNPALLAEAGRITLAHRITDALAGMQAGGMLFSWKSQVVNFATSAAQLVWRPTETLVGSTALMAKGAIKGDEALIAGARATALQSIKEMTYISSSLMDGFNSAVEAFLRGDSRLAPHMQEHTNLSPSLGSMSQDDFRVLNQMWRPWDSFENLSSNAVLGLVYFKNTAVLGSLRALGAADEMVKTIRYRSIVQAKAAVEGTQRGLNGKALNEFVEARLKASFDDNLRGIDEDALNEALASTFQNRYINADEGHFGALAAGYANFAAQNPALRLVTPFVKTPTNLFRYGIKLTPGVSLLQKQYAQDFFGKNGLEAQARAIGQMALGMMVTSIAAHLWEAGHVTGAGPSNYEEKKQWLSQGNRPYSITWKDEKGKQQYIELSRFDPITMPLTLTADFMQLWQGGALSEQDANSMASALVIAHMDLFKDKTYTRNLVDALQAVTDPRKLESYVRRNAANLMPGLGALSQFNMDSVMREQRHFYDGVLAKVPGQSSSLSPQRDFLGDVLTKPNGFTAETSGRKLTDELNDSFRLTGRYIQPPAPKSQATGGVDLRDFTLKSGRSAYDRYQQLAGYPENGAAPLKDTLSDLVHSEAYKSLPHGGVEDEGTKANLIMQVITKYRHAAFQSLLLEFPELRMVVTQRKRDIAKAVATGAKDVRAVGGQTRLDSFNAYLKNATGLSLPSVAIPPGPKGNHQQ